jgi:hypothetical protein
LLTASGQWNIDLVRQIFLPVDVEANLKIPLRNSSKDCLAWEPERHGLFSVKSAYRLLFNIRQQQSDVDQAGPSGISTWKLLWKLGVPPKVKVFWWRVLHGYLLAKHILHKIHVDPIQDNSVLLPKPLHLVIKR